MSRKSQSEPKALLKVVNDVLRMLEHNIDLPAEDLVSTEPLPSLYQQCLDMEKRIGQEAVDPIRTIHHFACTGGTLICKYLAATPNARVISEVDPLSPLSKLHFSPSDLILLYRHSIRPVQDSVLLEVFIAGLAKIYEEANYQGERLVLRDHTHSHFCTGPTIPQRPSLRNVLAAHFRLKSVVTVRHPLDAFLALRANKWVHFSPFTLDEFAQRHLAFLEEYEDVPIVKYEDFVATPEVTLQTLCDLLDLVYLPDLNLLTQVITLTGDSGRNGSDVKLRTRREEPLDVAQMRSTSKAYQLLCQRLKYDP